MCSNYLPATTLQLEQYFGVAPPDSHYKPEVYPGMMAPMIRKPRSDAGLGERACALAMFGMVPHWADLKLARKTYNARTETVASKPSFRNAYKHRQFCIVPVSTFFEPSYASGKAVRFAIGDIENAPLGFAGIWEHRPSAPPQGLPLLSFSMLTINADGHAVMARLHKPAYEKRMLAILMPDQYDVWLDSSVEDAPDFFVPYPANKLRVWDAPKSTETMTQ